MDSLDVQAAEPAPVAMSGPSISQEEPPVGVPAPTQPRHKVEFYGMNKNVVITGTVLSLLKIFQHNLPLSQGLKNNFGNFGKVILLKNHFAGVLAYLITMFGGTTATYSLLQKYVSGEKSSKWRTLDSLSTIMAIVFEGILLLNLGASPEKWNKNKNSFIPFQTFLTNNPKTLKILSSIFTITTLMGHKRGTNPLNSFLALLFIELVVLVNTLRFDTLRNSNKYGMVLIILLPFLWDHFEKGKNGKDNGTGKEQENKASEYYTYANIVRVLLVFLIMFLYFGGDKALIFLIRVLLKAIRFAK